MVCIRQTRYLQKVCEYLEAEGYELLIMALHDIPFKVVVVNDKNRLYDVKDIRRRFQYESDEPVSVLEILLCLAIKCEECIMRDVEKGDRTSQWFWMLIHNLNLECYDNVRIERDLNASYEINQIISIFNNRTYKRDGTCGGAFPLKNIHKDVRKADLWYQLNWYVRENLNYEFE